jgi:hypothetical protein
VRVPIFHEGTFRALVSAAAHGQQCLRYRGDYWEPVEIGYKFSFYRRTGLNLACLLHRIETYELYFYSRLLSGRFSADGAFRPYSRLRRGPSGAYRAADGHASAGVGTAGIPN